MLADHKPLLMIIDKPLIAAPLRLQRMLVRLQGYDFTMEYHPGADNQLADGLSHLPSPLNKTTIDLDSCVDFIRFSSEKFSQLQQETLCNSEPSDLRDFIISGWLDHLKDLPEALRTSCSFQDELSIENVGILKGERVIIPKSMRNDILQKLHLGHFGCEKTKLPAKDTVYWYNINKDIDQHCGLLSYLPVTPEISAS